MAGVPHHGDQGVAKLALGHLALDEGDLDAVDLAVAKHVSDIGGVTRDPVVFEHHQHVDLARVDRRLQRLPLRDVLDVLDGVDDAVLGGDRPARSRRRAPGSRRAACQGSCRPPAPWVDTRVQMAARFAVVMCSPSHDMGPATIDRPRIG